jgi:hypothetical protein
VLIFDAERFSHPSQKNCGHRRRLFFAFSFSDWGGGMGGLYFFNRGPNAKLAFCFLMRLPERCRATAPGWLPSRNAAY